MYFVVSTSEPHIEDPLVTPSLPGLACHLDQHGGAAALSMQLVHLMQGIPNSPATSRSCFTWTSVHFTDFDASGQLRRHWPIQHVSKVRSNYHSKAYLQ